MENNIELIKLRKSRGMTQIQLAIELKCSNSLICKLEKNCTSWTPEITDKINNFFGSNFEPKRVKEYLFKEGKEAFISQKTKYEEKNEMLMIENKKLKKQNRHLKVCFANLLEKIEGIFKQSSSLITDELIGDIPVVTPKEYINNWLYHSCDEELSLEELYAWLEEHNLGDMFWDYPIEELGDIYVSHIDNGLCKLVQIENRLFETVKGW